MPKANELRVPTPDEFASLVRFSKSPNNFESRRARFLRALLDPKGLGMGEIARAHGYSRVTAWAICKDFSSEGPSCCRYRLNHAAAAKRRLISPEEEARAVALACESAMDCGLLLRALAAEGMALHCSPAALRKVLLRNGLTWQRTRYSLKKKGRDGVRLGQGVN